MTTTTTRPLTFTATKAACRELGYTLRKEAPGESGLVLYRVGTGADAAHAYFTDCPVDALATCRAMADDDAQGRVTLTGKPATAAALAAVAAEDNRAAAQEEAREYDHAPANAAAKARVYLTAAKEGLELAAHAPGAYDATAAHYDATRAAALFLKARAYTNGHGRRARLTESAQAAQAVANLHAENMAAAYRAEAMTTAEDKRAAALAAAGPASLSAAAVPVVYLDDSLPGCVMLLNESGAWVGPGLGDFASAQAARDWATGRGYRVAPLMSPEEATATRAAAMRASLPALRASHASLDRRAASFGGLKAATLRARLRIVRDVARLKAGAIPGELAAAFALQVKPAPRPAMGRALAAVESLA